MIDFRYHLVSLIAVFLAVALGIVIGTTQLNGRVLDGLEAQVGTLTEEKDSLEAQNESLTAELNQDDAFDDAVAPLIVANRLVGSSVLLIVTSEDVSAEVVGQTTTLLQASGAELSGTLRLQPEFTDPQNAAELQEFVTGPGLPAGITLPRTDETAALVASLLSQVLIRPADGGEAPPQASTTNVLAGLAALGVVTSDSGEVGSADYALILTGEGFTGEDAEARSRALVTLAVNLDSAGSGGVVAGDANSAGDGGLVAALRNDASAASSVSTVNNVDAASGQVAALLALTAERTGESGNYGVGEGTVPLPSLGP
ncbi:MAG: copper transporter [Geodermatophilaceae bacterium]|nr:copper transporter [Geodermatophilaceae bacterium]